jgi:hypothetical protein
MNTESCDMVRVSPPESSGSLWDLNTGEFFFRTADNGQLWFNAMFPGQNLCCIPIRPLIDPTANGGQSWEWDKNEDKPTLTPSVNAVGCWHGWVRAGRMVSC